LFKTTVLLHRLRALHLLRLLPFETTLAFCLLKLTLLLLYIPLPFHLLRRSALLFNLLLLRLHLPLLFNSLFFLLLLNLALLLHLLLLYRTLPFGLLQLAFLVCALCRLHLSLVFPSLLPALLYVLLLAGALLFLALCIYLGQFSWVAEWFRRNLSLHPGIGTCITCLRIIAVGRWRYVTAA
jgi:hypothetical protein